MKETVTHNKLFFKLNLSQRIMLKFVDRELTQNFGATTTQLAVLFYLMENGECQLVDLSRELLQSKSAITTLVERMVKNGLLSKEKSKTDGRASTLRISDKGKKTAKNGLPFVTLYNNTLTEKFSEEEIETINRFFDSIIDQFETAEENFFKKHLQ